MRTTRPRRHVQLREKPQDAHTHTLDNPAPLHRERMNVGVVHVLT